MRFTDIRRRLAGWFHRSEPAPVALDTPEGVKDHVLQEYLRERRKDRRFQFIRTTTLTLLGAAYLLVMWINARDMTARPEKDYAAVVKVSGMIADGKEASYATLAPLLKRAFEDKQAKGVVLLINSPGGTPVQASLIHDLVVELKQKHEKRVVAVGEDMLTSGAYMIAVAADDIVVNRSTVAGSIGVISAGFGFTDLMSKVGVERRVATAGKSKSMLDPFQPQSPAGVAKQRELLTDIHAHFQDIVKDGRKERIKLDTPGLFEGSVWTGAQAVKIGLVDGLGSLDDALKKYFDVEATVFYARKRPMMESLLGDLGVAALERLVPQVSAPTAPQPLAVY